MKENRHRRGVDERSPRLTGLGRVFQALTEKIAPQVSRTIAALSILMSLAIALAVGPTIVGGLAPAHRTIDDISPNPGVLILGGSTEATVSLTSESSCLEAESDPGIDVQFTPACGSGVWSSTMMVSDNGGVNDVTLKVVVKEVDIDGSEIGRASCRERV